MLPIELTILQPAAGQGTPAHSQGVLAICQGQQCILLKGLEAFLAPHVDLSLMGHTIDPQNGKFKICE